MQFCYNCGGEVPEAARFCDNCGAPNVPKAGQQPAPEQAPPAGMMQQPIPQPQQPLEQYAPFAQPQLPPEQYAPFAQPPPPGALLPPVNPADQKKKNIIIISIISVVVLGLAGAGLALKDNIADMFSGGGSSSQTQSDKEDKKNKDSSLEGMDETLKKFCDSSEFNKMSQDMGEFSARATYVKSSGGSLEDAIRYKRAMARQSHMEFSSCDTEDPKQIDCDDAYERMHESDKNMALYRIKDAGRDMGISECAEANVTVKFKGEYEEKISVSVFFGKVKDDWILFGSEDKNDRGKYKKDTSTAPSAGCRPGDDVDENGNCLHRYMPGEDTVTAPATDMPADATGAEGTATGYGAEGTATAAEGTGYGTEESAGTATGTGDGEATGAEAVPGDGAATAPEGEAVPDETEPAGQPEPERTMK
jgi:hypothetical protein